MENSLPERAVREVLTSAKKIVTPGSYDPSKGLTYHVGKEVGDLLVRSVEEPTRLAGKAIGFVLKTTWNQVSSLIGKTVRLTGRAALNSPLFAVPISQPSASRREEGGGSLAA